MRFIRFQESERVKCWLKQKTVTLNGIRLWKGSIKSLGVAKNGGTECNVYKRSSVCFLFLRGDMFEMNLRRQNRLAESELRRAELGRTRGMGQMWKWIVVVHSEDLEFNRIICNVASIRDGEEQTMAVPIDILSTGGCDTACHCDDYRRRYRRHCRRYVVKAKKRMQSVFRELEARADKGSWRECVTGCGHEWVQGGNEKLSRRWSRWNWM